MASDTHTAERYTPQERRARLRAFADRMLGHLEDLAPPQDLAELERTVRVGLLIERLYARVDIAERRAPPPPLTPEQEAAEAAEAAQRRAEHHAYWVDRVNGLRLMREAEEAKTLKPAPAPVPAPSPPVYTDWTDDFEGYGDEDDDLIDDPSDEVMAPAPKPEPPLARVIDTQDPLRAPVQYWRPPERPDYGGG
ncbi:hypothetical protein Q1W73_10435 [Asticcacaulis sp. ZE23SCel15]|uniref:hypothetical protein n=1 Tax=Asticcacaulis sp. ZE23SCel15 TaxID=3059027 RepID=UPI00265F10C6|nr:hypothetical protein [Asticcacaulis sp. ZE23SCel15]WKL56116.1 hypothetical protein Q1W73_10435 [Asticcacaulis sp. ZE23SCel15]